MPITVERLPDEPILIATLTGNITVDDIKEVYRQSSALITSDDSYIFRITDVRQATTTFPEMLKSIQIATQEMPNSSTDERIRVTFVGNSIWANFVRNALQYQGVKMASFETMESALESVRIRIQKNGA